MRAVRYYGRKDIRVDRIPDPVAQPNEVIVAPAFCGICGTDMHEYLQGPIIYPSEPHILTGEKVPIVLGHEFSGVVIKVGEEVKDLNIGDRVAVKGSLFCGKCEPCQARREYACIKLGNIGQSGRGGGLAEKVACEEAWCHKLPHNLQFDIGALIEPLAVAEHGIVLAALREEPDQVALVLGAGAIGLAVVQLLRARGLSQIIVSEFSAVKRAAALAFGTSHVLDPKSTDVVRESKDICGGSGPHLVFDCAGAPSSLRTAAEAVRIHGTIVVLSIFTRSCDFDPNPLLLKEITYKGSLSHSPADWKAVINMLHLQLIDPFKMITNVIKMDRVVEDGIMALERADAGLIKILVEVNSPERLNELVLEAS